MTDSVALTALVVSLVALFTTIGQLLQQYFATADGYRRCQRSVMGLWARKTRLRWRWAEFRFETTFVTPRIIYRARCGAKKTRSGMKAVTEDECALVNTTSSLDQSMTLAGWPYDAVARQFYSGDELACWVPLLAQLHRQGEAIKLQFPPEHIRDPIRDRKFTLPVIQFINKSWDFMPSDVVRPMASTTVSDIGIMARRLGMVWKTFDPASGSMRAEGNGHTITSTVARSLGIILQYNFSSRDTPGQNFYLPVIEADMLGFGLVTVNPFLSPRVPFDLDIGSYEGLARTLPLLQFTHSQSPSKGVRSVLREINKAMKTGDDFIPGLNDLVPLLSGMLADPGMRRIPAPNLYSRGVTASEEGFRVFCKKLEDLVSMRGELVTEQSRKILSYAHDMDAKYDGMWELTERHRLWQLTGKEDDNAEAEAVSVVIVYHWEMEHFLSRAKLDYYSLVWVHIAHAVTPLKDLTSNSRAHNLYGLDPHDTDDRLVTSMESYFDALPSIASQLSKAYSHTLGTERHTLLAVEDAWLSMIFRAFCWHRSHEFIEGVPPLPSEYWNSKMPVYIG